MARKFKVKGTRDFLYAAVVLALISLWCIKDGWFPSASNLLEYGTPDNPAVDHATYYTFNRVTAVVTGLASFVCIIVHRFVK